MFHQHLHRHPHSGLDVKRSTIDAGWCLAGRAAEIELHAIAHLGDLHPEAACAVSRGTVAVQRIFAFVDSVRNSFSDRVAHGVCRNITGISDRSQECALFITVNRFKQQSLAQQKALIERFHVGENQVAEPRIVEDQVECRPLWLIIAIEQHRRDHQTGFVDVVLGSAETAGHGSTHVELVRPHSDERHDLAAIENRPDKTDIVYMQSDAIGIVGDQHIARTDVFDPEFLDDVADTVAHGESENRKAV